MLLEMIKKREKLKREYISVITAIAKLELIVQKKRTDGFSDYKPLSKLKREKREVELVNDEESSESEVSDGEEELTSPDYEEQNGDTDQDDNEEEDIYTKENTINEYDTSYSSVQLPGLSEFRGRARVGRGGRIIFDRICMYKDKDPSTNFIQNGWHNTNNKNYNTRNNGINHIQTKDNEEMQLDEPNICVAFDL